MNRQQSELRQGHEYILDRLSAYMDEQLQVSERARVEAHLNACPSCRDELRTLQWTKNLLRQAPSVPLLRSFVLREADLAPQQARRQASTRWMPAFALQWATALVAILLVVVVTGDLFLGRRAALPGGQEVALLSTEMSEGAATVVVESESVEAPALQAAPESTESETPVEAQKRIVAPTATAAEGAATSSTPDRAQVMEKSEVVTDTLNVPLMAVQSTPEAVKQEETPATPAEGNVPPPGDATPQGPAEKAFGAQDAAGTPIPSEETVEQPEGTPLAMALPQSTPEGELPREPRAAEWEALSGWLERLRRDGWRMAEVGLGLLLAGLVVAVVWVRRTK